MPLLHPAAEQSTEQIVGFSFNWQMPSPHWTDAKQSSKQNPICSASLQIPSPQSAVEQSEQVSGDSFKSHTELPQETVESQSAQNPTCSVSSQSPFPQNCSEQSLWQV